MRPGLSWVLACTLVPLPVAAGAATPEIEHTALGCTPVDRYARIAGRSVARAGRAELQFRSGAAGGWYSVRMTEHGGEWTAFLPRPTSARQIEYRIVMTGSDSVSATSPDITVAVQEACDSDAQPSVPSPIVIRVPEGAPAVP